MEIDQSTYLLDLPDEVLEEIVNFLPFFAVRKNLRLTCKRLYKLCDLDRFYRDEVIVWSKESKSHIVSAFQSSTRGYFSLIFSDVTLNLQQVSKFFEQHGAKVQSLSFVNCKCPPGLLESIVVRCEALCSLTIRRLNACTFSFESNRVTRPTVTSLELVLDSAILQQSPLIFQRIASLFPRVKHLIVEADPRIRKRFPVPDYVILYFVTNFSHLESLKLNVRLNTSLLIEPTFLDLLPKLEKLRLSLESRSHLDSAFWNTLTSRMNVSLVELDEKAAHYPCDFKPLLNVPGLKHLSYSATMVYICMDTFTALASSQLQTISLQIVEIEMWGVLTNSPAKSNETVTDLSIQREPSDFDHTFIMMLFAVHFRGVVHLEMGTVNDRVLEYIFKYQKNLRSLVLEDTQHCTITGFCGEKSKNFENSITNLQNLEHLSIKKIDARVLQSKMFQKAFNLPNLKYLRISVNSSALPQSSGPTLRNKSEIPVDMLKTCVNLEALHLGHFSTPSSTVLSSLFQYFKHLHYLHFFSLQPAWIEPARVNFTQSQCTYVNLKHFHSVDWAKLRLDRNTQTCHYDEELDRTVFTAKLGRNVPLTSPKFSFYTVDWININ